ncbi:MAG: tRNA-dihydrouridine synthase, partial [Planctomycetales bacterium]|nr:tRNA-dihydrouridine synthase [Planctomycetales bacterium]
TILGSGDLFTAADCWNMIEQTGIDGVTAARGAIGNPWIFRQARDLAAGRTVSAPSLFEQREVMREHYRLAEEIYDERRCGILMRKFGIKYAASHPRHVEVREAFTKIRSRADWWAILDAWYAEDLPGVLPSAAVHTGHDSCEEAA